jgi:hypothetical protein
VATDDPDAVAWLRQQIEGDKATAEAAAPGPWDHDLAAMAAFIEARLAEAGRAADPGVCGCLDASHVPSCVPTPWRDQKLRDVESTRKLLAEIQAMSHLYLDDDAFFSCAQAVHPEPYEGDTGSGSGCLDENRRGKPCDCGRDSRGRRMLAAIAMRWAGHPDYLAGWAPGAVGG